ncbi:MAG: polysaccharide deacetylase family protein [Chryseolinea sp.]
MIHRTPFILPLLYPTLTWRQPVQGKELFLTFDDGPVPGPTEFVLETLASKKAQATFFCIGDNVRKHPDVFRRIGNNGHAIGNHTFHHKNGWRTSAADYVDNVKASQEIMEQIGIGHSYPDQKLFRPPYGRITRRQVRMLKEYRIIMWDVLTIDYNARLSGERCLSNSIKATRNGSIIVFHDSLKAERNLRYALPRFIDHFHQMGFSFKSLAL